MLVLSLLTKRTASLSASSPKSSSLLMAVDNRTRTWFSTNNDKNNDDNDFYTIGLTGSTGLVGTAFRDELSRRATVNGKPVRVVQLVRNNTTSTTSHTAPTWTTNDTTVSLEWNPQARTPEEIVSLEAVEAMDALVHLSGENVATGLGPLGFLGIRPWTDAKKQKIVDSRVQTTSALSSVLAQTKTPTVFLSASGVGAYGDQFFLGGAEAADESTDVSQTSGFLAHVSRQWEAATTAAKSNKAVRVVNMRFGVLLSKKGGALEKLYPVFFLGGGGVVGSGTQYFPFISARDHARALVHALETPSLEGPVNMCAPDACTNADFTKAFGKVLNRPTIIPLPAPIVNLMFGEMGQEMLLGGTRAKPTKLLESGFAFEHPDIEQALQSAVTETI